MPPGEGLGGHHSQCLAPVEPAAQPDEGETGGIRCAFRLDVALLIQGELLAEKEILRRQHNRCTQAKPEETHGVEGKCQQHGCHIPCRTEEAWDT